MVNSINTNVTKTNIPASKPQQKNKKNTNLNSQEQEAIKKIKSYTNAKKFLGSAAIGTGALAAVGSFAKSKTLKSASAIPAAVIASFVGYNMYSGAVKTDAEVKKIESSAKQVNTLA